MRGIEFFSALTEARPTDSRWSDLAAGIVVFRLAEAALNDVRTDRSLLSEAKRQVAGVTRLTLNLRLRDILKGLESPAQRDSNWRRTVGRKLMAYGLELHRAGEYGPAADAFALIYECVPDDPALHTQAMQQRAFMLRLLARFDDAEVVYHHLEQSASEVADVATRLEAQLGMARLVAGRGNLPAAEDIIRSVVRDARHFRQATVAANGLIDLAWIAGARHKPDEVLTYSYEALPHIGLRSIDGDELRERTLINIATALRELSRSTAATTVARHVATVARSADLRAAALTVLYHVAIDDRNAPMAAAYRDALATERMATTTALEYYEAMTREHATFERFADARVSAKRMLAVSEVLRLNEFSFRAEAALKELANGRVPNVL